MLRLLRRSSLSPWISLTRHQLKLQARRNSSNSPVNPSLANLQTGPEPPNPPPSVVLHDPNHLSPIPSPPPKKLVFFATSATVISATALAAFFLSSEDQNPKILFHKVSEAASYFSDRLWKTGAAASVLWKSLRSVMSSANQGVRLGFELRVASLLADIAAANEGRRAAIVGAGKGAVVDWLLESASGSQSSTKLTQAEAARALSYLISDGNVCEAVMARPHAIPCLLRFIFSSQLKHAKMQIKQTSFDNADILRGRSMLVAAIMDIVTSDCDSGEKVSFHPPLSKTADMRDIGAALQVVEEGGMRLDETHDDDGDKGMRGIGIKILGGTTVVGVLRTANLLEPELSDIDHFKKFRDSSQTPHLRKNFSDSPEEGDLSSLSGKALCHLGFSTRRVEYPGLWDDLQSRHVAVPFAAWALANWASASDINRSHIQELDRDGNAIMTALKAPERTVRWHGSLVARLLLEDSNLPLVDSVPEWSSCFLSTASQATKSQDIPLAQMALSAFLISIDRSSKAKEVVMEKGLNLMRDIAKQTAKNKNLREKLARALELLNTGDMHMSLEEGQKWSGILLPWVLGKELSDGARLSVTKILSCILEDYGPASIVISQAWLTLLLSEVLGMSKASFTKGIPSRKGGEVKAQIDQSNAQAGALIANQLVSAVIYLSGRQLRAPIDNVDGPLADLLSLEPFSESLKGKNKDNLPKLDAANIALATLKGIKGLTELCSEDTMCQNKLADSGVLCLLRRFLLCDDYEHLAAIEAYDASRDLEKQDRGSNMTGERSVLDANDPSSIRIPATAHIRRHAARLLTVLSLLPKVQKCILKDEAWCKWLDDCANGKVSGCNDLKIQSYARATLLNISCSKKIDENSGSDSGCNSGVEDPMCPQFDDKIFFINPEIPPSNCFDNENSSRESSSATSREFPVLDKDNDCEYNMFVENSNNVYCADKNSQAAAPLVDVVFVHGLRGGPFKTWRIADDKSSTTSKSGLIENIDQEAGKQGTCWPREWLATDLPNARLFTIKYKTNLTQWSGASLPLQEVSSVLLKKLVSAGIGERPVVFVTHSMGGLVVKQLLYQARKENIVKLVNNTLGVVFYSCPHFGSKLADMPWRMGLVLRPAPSITELRSGSPWLVELNDFVRQLQNKGSLQVLSFSETQVTPIVEGYGGWALRMEIVPIESAYPGFGELVVLEATDHINSCKPVNRSDPSYKETLDFLQKLRDKAKSS
ncbi:uncharacterized protein LOC18433074 isoform X2 [Amborella trichopoda]|uniref:GPI inositol-deacylase n=1 Tax=Amborella trichopoda TaxID=13333 RepID=W1PB30_AMBTC|nr:uncharacterized protein LOC18433074 isoform X2 [Amborella trichopoda]ERN04909.1 hypothetical protein AMTR_s00080p00068060 [Amborella trichopoda]|eukprot:XP_020522168.1 uncharacterized protein LOC18433074 isoform X2 [Amborella trichopoda]